VIALAGEHVTDALRRCGVVCGDTLMLHSDAIVAAQFAGGLDAAERIDLLIDATLAALGSEGTLVMPTFTYSFTRGEDFDPATSPSTVGAVTERFRCRPGVRRSANPLFSVAAFGRLASEFAATAVENCFGPRSAFDLLLRRDGVIACLGCAFDRITFVHYVEQCKKVEYRYIKRFDGALLRDGERETAAVDYLVRDLSRDTPTDLGRLAHKLRAAGRLRSAPVGRFGLAVVTARDFFDAASDLLAEDPAALIREGARRT
jgi:aminoglycoside 3-N-acetyltransferase